MDKEEKALIFMFLFSIWAMLFFLAFCDKSPAYTIDRCQDYITEERIQHQKYFGLSYPYWYGIGQIKQESACRTNIVSFDGGMGLSQFMPRTWSATEKDMGMKLNPYNPEHSIKAQAFYMANLHKQNWDGALWLTYCFYNSGTGTMKKEYARSICSHCHKEAFYNEMKAVCSRKVIRLKNGNLLDLCNVGYDYPKKVYLYSQRYKIFSDEWRYW